MRLAGHHARVHADHREHAVPPWFRRWSCFRGQPPVRLDGRYQRGRNTVVAHNTDGFDELAVPLDLLLTRPVFGLAERISPNMSWRRFAANLARQPGVVASRAGTLGRELGAIAAGRSEIAPAKGDKRFADPAWVGNPILKRTMQAYLAANETVDQLFSDARLDWRDAEQMRFVLDFVTEGLAPSNIPFVNPLGYKAVIDTGGMSMVRGLRHFVSDMRKAPRVPSMVEPDAFTVGETVAATAGSVVFRDEVFELIQYTPQTDTVWTVPLLMVPPVINKFYVLDISPGRSMIEYFLGRAIRSSRSHGVIRLHNSGIGASTPTARPSWTRSRQCRRSPTPSACTCRRRVLAASSPP